MRMLHRFYLLFLALLVLPLATQCDVVCIGHGNRTASSYLEANIRDFAAILPNKTSSTPSRSANHVTGEFPEGMYAASYCHNGTKSSFCRACIALALQEAHTVCPYHKGAVFSNGNCSLKLSALIYANPWEWDDDHKEGFFMMRRVATEDIMAMVFQVIGFAWLFFLLRLDCRDRERRSMIRSIMQVF